MGVVHITLDIKSSQITGLAGETNPKSTGRGEKVHQGGNGLDTRSGKINIVQTARMGRGGHEGGGKKKKKKERQTRGFFVNRLGANQQSETKCAQNNIKGGQKTTP